MALDFEAGRTGAIGRMFILDGCRDELDCLRVGGTLVVAADDDVLCLDSAAVMATDNLVPEEVVSVGRASLASGETQSWAASWEIQQDLLGHRRPCHRGNPSCSSSWDRKVA